MESEPDEDDGDAGLPEESLTTVSELNAAIADRVESAANLHSEFIVGEVADNGVSDGTRYFQLTDDDASIQCLVFNRYRGRIDIDIENGMEIAVVGEISYYEEKGRCSILVHDAIVIGEGAYQRKLKELRQELTVEGLFEDECKQSLPDFPEAVGLVTSAGSDAQEDTINTIHSRYPDVDVLVHGTSVQGDRAVGDLQVAIQTLDSIPKVDVLIVTRGGGSEEDLRTFNEESVVRTVAETTTPAIVAIGHEMDRTLAGEAADYRAITPTHAGESVVTEKGLLTEQLQEYREAVDSGYARVVEQHLESYRDRVEEAYTALETEYEHQQKVAATQRRYRMALAVAVIVLLLVLIAWWLL